jgi:hypothetical protein
MGSGWDRDGIGMNKGGGDSSSNPARKVDCL